MKIKGQPGFIRDTHSGAIINNDIEAYKLYKERRKKSIEKDKKIEQLEDKIGRLENLVNELIRQNKN
tara:strand:- start:80 stop:280 length:201 start_codon:yes stop_codon:yes gene_type:complete